MNHSFPIMNRPRGWILLVAFIALGGLALVDSLDLTDDIHLSVSLTATEELLQSEDLRDDFLSIVPNTLSGVQPALYEGVAARPFRIFVEPPENPLYHRHAVLRL